MMIHTPAAALPRQDSASLQNTPRGGVEAQHRDTQSCTPCEKNGKVTFRMHLFHMIAFSRHVGSTRLDDGVRRFVSSAFRIGLSPAILVFSRASLTAFGGNLKHW